MKTLLIRPSLCMDNLMPFMPMNIFVLGSYINELSDVIIWDFPIKYGIPLTKKNYLRIFEKFKDEILSEEPQVVGISCTSGDEYIPTLRIARAVKEVLPSASVVVGGYHASSCAEEMLKESNNIDCIIIGEGEEPLKRILQNKLGKKAILQDVEGIATLRENRAFRTDPIQVDVNDLPFLSMDFIEQVSVYPNTSIELSRGCPYKCNFCQESLMRGRLLRLKNPKQAIDELEYLRKNLDSDYFFFHDASFGANEEWLKKICGDICQRNLDIKWFAMVRSTSKKETLQMMSKAGAYSLFFGLESGSPEMLRQIDKMPGTSDYTNYLKKSEECLVESVKADIIPIIGVIIGYPGENQKTMLDTANYLKKVYLKCKEASDTGFWIDSMFYLPLPKTRAVELFAYYEKEFGTKLIADTQWWKQDFPFLNYFNTIFLTPSKNVAVEDLQRQRKLLSRMNFLAERSYIRSFPLYCQTSGIQKLRQELMEADVFPTKEFLRITSERWRNQQIQPYKVPIIEEIRKRFSRLFNR